MCPSAEAARPGRRGGSARSCRGLTEPLSILLRLQQEGWSRLPGQEGWGQTTGGLSHSLNFQAPSPWSSPFRPRHPLPSRGAAAPAGGAEPACVQPGPSLVETGERALELSELREGTSRWPPASGIPSRRRVGW